MKLEARSNRKCTIMINMKTTRREFVRAMAAGAVAAAYPGFAAAKGGPSSSKPNVVVILADDFGYGDVGCYNPESKVPTPNMDKLATQGMRFTDAHSPAAVCTPTRYSVLTGRMAIRSKLGEKVFF
jgi:arylsulfatase A